MDREARLGLAVLVILIVGTTFFSWIGDHGVPMIGVSGGAMTFGYYAARWAATR